ncbi:hypothetical protein BGZ80_002482 [Entomortierella chlamydospora]|uniref:Uncharacterized protein n=1 Tax=Entomortierella chlamydospora TaxID=101097 RepID=A0A9P6MPS9_9FUNG|nr:hypothetical protein BGZ79_001993 [Entomortierella chlamydospora]KAG0009351.1 hypothetical protein BGZ80_002482 [Entomortierella chlamydospora]
MTEPKLSSSTAQLEDPPVKSVFAFLKSTQRHSTTNMPALIRTKAQSSVRRESGSFMQPRSVIADAPQSHALINIQEPELAFNPTSMDSSSSATSSDFSGTLRLARKQQCPDITTPSKMPVRSGRSTVPKLFPLDMPPQANSSIIAKSYPNGSLTDAASVQAIYCHSLRSTMS